MRAADSRDALERWQALLACAPVSDRVFPDPHERLTPTLGAACIGMLPDRCAEPQESQ